MFKLALNAGHGYNTAGKRCMKSIDQNETREYVLNRRICDKIGKILHGYKDVTVIRTDDGSELSISKRAARANNANADLYLSIHHNAGIKGGKGGGIEAYTYLFVGNETKEWQQLLYDEVIKTTQLRGNRAQPLRKANFGECRQTKMSAVLLECGYMDSIVDTPIILTDDFAEKVAEGCVNAIVKKAELVKNKSTVLKEPEKTAQKNTPKTTEELAREVILGRWGNGAERKQRLTAAGYDYKTVQSLVNKILKG